MTTPHLMNCPHSTDGWCLMCVSELHDQKDSLATLLSDIALFEATVDAGPGREVGGASVHLYPDGSGELMVSTNATADAPGVEAMLNRVFFSESHLPFDSLSGLRAILRNLDAMKPKHPEVI